MIDWDNWRSLLAVVRHGTYSAAARALRVDATTVARRLKYLEGQLGYALFVRDGDRFHPSSRCEELLVHLESAAEALRLAEHASAGADQGAAWRTLRMTAPPFLIGYLLAPSIGQLTRKRRYRVELVGTASKAGLQRREADIALRIEDRRGEISMRDKRIRAERLGALDYAVYRSAGSPDEPLPWAGLVEDQLRTSGSEAMVSLAGEEGFQFGVHQFQPLVEIVASGAAKAMLPCFIADGHPGLVAEGETVLSQPLWMLYHRQDQEDPSLKAVRAWVAELVGEQLSG